MESPFLTSENEERLAEGLRRALISANPNPNREGCPDPKTIRDLAFHKRIGDPATFERITNHMAECSPCVRDALGFAEEHKENRKRHRTVSLAVALAATLLLAVALWAIWHVQPQWSTIAKSSAVPTQPSNPPLIASAGDLKNQQAEIPKIEQVSIELPMTWRGSATPVRPIILPRGHLQLEIRLPIGSPDGTYKIRISDKSGKALKTSEGTTLTQEGHTQLKAALNTSDLKPGNYTLGILEPGIDEWSDYLLTIK